MNHRQPIILIADPDAERATTLSSRLDRNGYHVLRRASGIDALECVQQVRPDLVVGESDLLDLESPELLRSIREISPSTRILFITRHGDGSNLQEDIRPDLMTPLFVPTGVDEVVRVVDRLLAGVPLRASIAQA